MDLEKFMRKLTALVDAEGLEDEGIEVWVNGSRVTGVSWDGNTTLNIEIEEED